MKIVGRDTATLDDPKGHRLADSFDKLENIVEKEGHKLKLFLKEHKSDLDPRTHQVAVLTLMQLMDKVGIINQFLSTIVGSQMDLKTIAKKLKETIAFHPKDDLLGAITFEELITTIQSNEPEVSPRTAEKVFKELLAARVKDAQYEFKRNVKKIVEEAQ